MLASDLLKHLGERPGIRIVALPRADLDVCDSRQIRAALLAHRPDAVIHTAVYHVEPCEADPERGYRINAWAAGIVAQACEEAGSIMVQVSTGGLFGDDLRAYHEYDPVVLKTVYAKTKHAAETLVQRHCRRHYILRTGWLYGGSPQHQRNFVAARYREALKKPVMQGAGDKFGSPTSTVDFAEALPAILESGQFGLYHVTNAGGCSRADYVQHALRAFGLATVVDPVDSSHFPRKADVPACEILTSYNLPNAGLPLLPPWEDALDRYVASIKDQVR